MLNWILGYQSNTQQPPAAPAPETVASEAVPTTDVEPEKFTQANQETAESSLAPPPRSPVVDLLEEGDGSAVIIHVALQSETKVNRSNEEVEGVNHGGNTAEEEHHSEAQSAANISLPKESHYVDEADCYFTSSSDDQSPPTPPTGTGLRAGSEGRVDESEAESWIFIGSSEGKGNPAILIGTPPPLEAVLATKVATDSPMNLLASTSIEGEEMDKEDVSTGTHRGPFAQEERGAETHLAAVGSSLSHSRATACEQGGCGDATGALGAPLPAVRDAPVRLEKGARHAIIADEEEAWRSLWWRFDQLKAAMRAQARGGGYSQDLASSRTSSATPSQLGPSSATAEPLALTDSAAVVTISAPNLTDEGTLSSTAATNSDIPDVGTTCSATAEPVTSFTDSTAETSGTLMCDVAPTTIFTSSSLPAHPVEGRGGAEGRSAAPQNASTEEEEQTASLFSSAEDSEQHQQEEDGVDECNIDEALGATTAEVTTGAAAGPNSACHGTDKKEEKEFHSIPSSEEGQLPASALHHGDEAKLLQLTWLTVGATDADSFVDNNAYAPLPTPPLTQASSASTSSAATSSSSSAAQSKNKRQPSTNQSSVSRDSLEVQQREAEVDAGRSNKSNSATNTALLALKASNQPPPPPPPPPYHLAVASDTSTNATRPTPSPSSSSRQQAKAGSEANSVRSDVRGPPPPYPYPLASDDFITAARVNHVAVTGGTSVTTAGISTEASSSVNSSSARQTNSASSSSRKGSHQSNHHHHRGQRGGATCTHSTADDDASIALAISLRAQYESELMEMQQALARRLQAEEDAKIRRQQSNTTAMAGNGAGARRCDCLGARKNIHRKGCPMQNNL